MRAGGCTVQQALTAEAAAVVKQAVSLARRRGNAQVTPLHVASAMLQVAGPGAAAPATTGLLRAACLRSHSHPLQCKALELCFNVALNRLPASAGASPLLGHGAHHVYYPPSLSNALVAAFKRAQAHQRRGSVETQQQPVLAVKIELEQLVISILDDPSVSRVMREAGFSSTQVKANVEQAVSSIEASKPCTTTAAPQNPNPSGVAAGSSPVQEAKPSRLPLDQVREEDVAAILDCLATRSKKRIMVVAECASAALAAARAAVDRIRCGEARQQHEALRLAQVVTISMSRFRDAPRDEAERRLAELRCVVKACAGAGNSRAVVLVVEDLAWAAEFWAGRVAADAAGRRPPCGYYYCAVEHAVAEVRALACRGGTGCGGGDGVWLVGHGTYQTNMRCRAGHPSLESLWGLQTLAVPAGSLALSLTCADAADIDSGAMAAVNHQSAKARCDRAGNGSNTTSPCLSLLDAGGACSGQVMAVSACCGDCATTKALPRSVLPPSTATSSIPPWLQHHCRDQEPPHMKKWMSAHGGLPSHRTALNISTVVSPCSSVSSYEQCYQFHQPYQPWLVADDEAEETKHQWKSRCRGDVVGDAANGDRLLPVKVKSHDSSASNGSVEVECHSRFKELSAENLKVLCGALEKEVPWQKEIVPEIASTVLRCRSGMAKRSRDDGGSWKPAASSKEHTWMLFLGGDMDGKVRVARELASLVFGSSKSFVFIGAVNASSSSPARSDDSTEQPHRSKRPRPETTTTSGRGQDHLERLYDAVRDNPRRVILMEHVDQTDRLCQQGIREAIESGVVRSRRDGGEEATVLGDAIVVLSCESFSSSSTTSTSPPAMIKKAKTADGTSGREELNEDDHRRKETITAALSSSCFDLNMSVAMEEDEAEERCSDEAGQLLLKAVDSVLFFRSIEEL